MIIWDIQYQFLKERITNISKLALCSEIGSLVPRIDSLAILTQFNVAQGVEVWFGTIFSNTFAQNAAFTKAPLLLIV